MPQLHGKVEKVCFFCHKPGHIVADCKSLRHKQQDSVLNWPKGVGLIKTVSLMGQDVSSESDECFKPFISKGYVSLTGNSEDQRPVTVLRDTACSQSFILAGVLPLGAESACNVNAAVRGIEMRLMPSPLHGVHIKGSDLFLPSSGTYWFPHRGCSFYHGE